MNWQSKETFWFTIHAAKHEHSWSWLIGLFHSTIQWIFLSIKNWNFNLLATKFHPPRHQGPKVVKATFQAKHCLLDRLTMRSNGENLMFYNPPQHKMLILLILYLFTSEDNRAREFEGTIHSNNQLFRTFLLNCRSTLIGKISPHLWSLDVM